MGDICDTINNKKYICKETCLAAYLWVWLSEKIHYFSNLAEVVRYSVSVLELYEYAFSVYVHLEHLINYLFEVSHHKMMLNLKYSFKFLHGN